MLFMISMETFRQASHGLNEDVLSVIQQHLDTPYMHITRCSIFCSHDTTCTNMLAFTACVVDFVEHMRGLYLPDVTVDDRKYAYPEVFTISPIIDVATKDCCQATFHCTWYNVRKHKRAVCLHPLVEAHCRALCVEYMNTLSRMQ